MFVVANDDDGPQIGKARQGVMRKGRPRMVHDDEADVLARNGGDKLGLGRVPLQSELAELHCQMQRLARDFNGAFYQGQSP